MSPGDEAAHGRDALTTGRILSLKDRLNLSWPVLANLIGVDAASLKMWVEGTREPSHASARKLGAWMMQVQRESKQINQAPNPDDLVSLSMASQYLGMSYAMVLEKCQARELTCVDLGALGVYILKSDIPNLEDSRD